MTGSDHSFHDPFTTGRTSSSAVGHRPGALAILIELPARLAARARSAKRKSGSRAASKPKRKIAKPAGKKKSVGKVRTKKSATAKKAVAGRAKKKAAPARKKATGRKAAPKRAAPKKTVKKIAKKTARKTAKKTVKQAGARKTSAPKKATKKTAKKAVPQKTAKKAPVKNKIEKKATTARKKSASRRAKAQVIPLVRRKPRIYSPRSTLNSFMIGDDVIFRQVRDWNDASKLVEMRGTVIGIGMDPDNRVNYIEVQFEVQSLSGELNKQVRRFAVK